MKILTVLIPAYNIEKYVDRVLHSVLLPEVEKTVEVLLINDGSTDRTGERAERYRTDHPNFRVITQKNGGHGSAVNRGLQEASGKYIKILDGDDIFAREAYLSMITQLSKVEADLILTPYYKIDVTSKRKRLMYYPGIATDQIYLFSDLSEKLGRLYMQGVAFRTDIFRCNHIYMSENCYYDDFEFTFFPLPYIKTVYYIDHPVYSYFIGRLDQSVSAQKAFQNLDMLDRILEDSLHFWREREGDTSKLYLVKKRNISSLMNNIANVYLRNAFDDAKYDTFREAWSRLEESYPTETSETMKSFRHIRIAKANRAAYYGVALIFRAYKKMEGIFHYE